MQDSDIEAKDLARMIAFGRMAIGFAAFVAPKRFARAWTGDTAEEVASSIATRGLGARDVALGLGTLIALENDGPVRGWLEAQAIADASDAFATLTRFGDLPLFGRWVSLAVEAGACYMNLKLIDELG